MFLEENLNITTQLTPVSFQTSKDSLSNPPDPYSVQAMQDSLKDIRQFYTFSFQTSEDSLNIASQLYPFQLQENKKPLTRFFVEKGKVEINEIKREKNQIVPLWIHLSFLFWLIVMLFIRQSYMFRLRQIILATYSQQQARQLYREGNILKQGFPVLLMFLFTFSLSLFAFEAIKFQFPGSFNLSFGQSFLLLFGAIIFLHFTKFISIWLLGFLFETRQISGRYLNEHYIFYISEGIILLPLLILYIYSGAILFMYIAVIVLFALWIYRLFRAVIVGLDCTNYSRSYLFLYLCTLEVLPIFLLYKLSIQFV